MKDAPLPRYSDRSCSPDETMARILPLLPNYGISRLARLTSLDCIGIPVWNAVAPNARSIVINQGKGIHDIDAKVSAAMEALERAVAGNPGIAVRQASLLDLQAQGLLANSLDTLILAGARDVQPDETIRWVAGHDLVAGRDVWVPFEAVALDDTRPSRFWQSSDGLASGNTLEEASFHGLLERVERDAEALCQYAPLDERRSNCIDVESLRDPVIDGLIGRVRAAGFRIQLFDMTSDNGVPAIEAFIAPHSPSSGEVRYIEMTRGAGAHPSWVRAAIRAITEAAQSRLTYISGARDDITPETFARPLPEHLHQLLFMEPNPNWKAPRSVNDATLSDMLRWVIDRLKAVGVASAIIVDLNPEERAFSVAKVLVPGLENPDGRRKRRLGSRALKNIMRSR
jgi:ribosomal protein S12 methylthiotransferase accessory factor